MSNYIPTNLTSLVKEDYLAYSLSVIVGRAIPRYTDGCKPIARRIFTAIKMLNLKPDGRFMKSARLDGEVLGKYSPHGSAYGAIVTLAAPWNNNYPLINGHGNFGDSTSQCAAARYTEVKSSPLLWEGVLDDSDTWETVPNYDGSLQEPMELNVKFPLVLLNGQEGIGVGYACKIAPHNLRSIVEATKLLCKHTASEKAYKDNLSKARDILIPDFPTGTQIIEDDQLKQYKETGSGSIRCMAKLETSVVRHGKGKERPCLTFTNLPPGTNPEKIGEQIKAELEKGRIEGVAEVNDLSDLSGDRVQVVAKAGINADTLKNQLYSFTDLELKFSAKTLVIDGNKPVELSPVEIVQKWVHWRLNRLQAKFVKELSTKEARLSIVQGLLKAIGMMDLVIGKIRESKDKAQAKSSLMSKPFMFTDDQAESILDMRLRQLTNLDEKDLILEDNELQTRIKELEKLASDEAEGTTCRSSYMTQELTELGKRHGEARRSPLVEPPSHGGTYTPGSPTRRVAAAPKPRFLKVDVKKGLVEQAKGPRGALVLESKDKLVLLNEAGFLKKVAPNYKGPVSTNYCPILLAKKDSEILELKYLVVFENNEELRAMVLCGSDLVKTTSKGKLALPEGSKIVYFGEGSYTVNWASKRKKPLKLDLTAKQGRPGSKGIKVAMVEDLS